MIIGVLLSAWVARVQDNSRIAQERDRIIQSVVTEIRVIEGVVAEQREILRTTTGMGKEKLREKRKLQIVRSLPTVGWDQILRSPWIVARSSTVLSGLTEFYGEVIGFNEMAYAYGRFQMMGSRHQKPLDDVWWADYYDMHVALLASLEAVVKVVPRAIVGSLVASASAQVARSERNLWYTYVSGGVLVLLLLLLIIGPMTAP